MSVCRTGITEILHLLLAIIQKESCPVLNSESKDINILKGVVGLQM